MPIALEFSRPLAGPGWSQVMRTNTANLTHQWLRGALVTVEVALAVVLLSAVTAFATIAMGFRARAQGRPSARWLCSAAILTLPLVLVLGPLG